jgi:TolB-like protein/Tfp pilus assembly protein PilF
MSLINELKRRHVFKVAIAYLAVAWLVLQIADIISPILELPPVFARGILVALAIGFPIALVFAWALELTPEGIRRETKAGQESASRSTGGTLNTIIIGVLSIAVVLFALDKFVRTDADPPVKTTADGQRNIAVLPFVNMSDDPEQEYFSDGLSEELLNLLAQIPELRVTSRTSAFSFKDKDVTIPEVGRALGVDHVLEGSVRRSGDQIRITAQLIKVADDSHVWSDTWDREFADVFVIQEEIAASVVDELRIRLVGAIPSVFETTREAYELFLRAKVLIDQPSAPNLRRAEDINQRVLDIDPGYAPAWLQRAWIFQMGPGWNTWETDVSAPQMRDAALQAIALEEGNAEAHAILVRLAIDYEYDYDVAKKQLETALRLGSDNVSVLRAAAEYEYRQGNLDKSIGYLEKAYAIDPVEGRGITGALAYSYAGRYEEAIAIWEDSILRSPATPYLHKAMALSLLEMGDVDRALEVIEDEPTRGHRLHCLALIYETIGEHEKSREALEALIADGNRWTFEITEVHSFRGEIDEAFEWVNRAIDRRDRGLRHLMNSPYIDNMREDPRFDGVLARLGLARDP